MAAVARGGRRITVRICVAMPILGLAVAAAAAAATEPREQGAAPPPSAATLRLGVEALEAGRLQEAIALFEAVAAGIPAVADHAERLRLRALAAGGKHAAVREGAKAFARRFPRSPVAEDVWRLRAEAAAAQGDPAAAQRAWQEARARAPDVEIRAEIAADRARFLEARGETEEAAQAWAELFGAFAAEPAAQAAPEALARLEEALGRPLRTAPLLAERARALYDARENEGALEAAEAALAGALPPTARAELLRLRAFTLFRLRRYPAAARAFEALGDDPEARLYHARSLARSGRIQPAVEAFEGLGREPGTSLGARALFLAATLLEDETAEDRARAREHYATVAARAPFASQRAEARWRLGWLAWQDNDAERAAAAFEAAAKLEADLLGRLRPRYWHARALDRLGRSQEAERALGLLLQEFPLTYYGLRAAERLGLRPGGSDPGAEAGGRTREPRSPGELTLPDRALTRAAILLEAQLEQEARRELPGLVAEVRSDADRIALARMLAEAGDPHAAQHVVVRGQGERLARGVEPGLEALWRLAWPRAFAEPLEQAARRHGVDPALVFAVMREESGYRPEVVSPVGARGLVQIMPQTGARLARQLGWLSLDPARLFAPACNLELGSFYLAELLARFRGRHSAAIAAYNAGPRAVARWLDARGDAPDDAWVESIPYDQTRQYVRRVLRSWHVQRLVH